MKNIVYLFDGQGAFAPGIGKDLYTRYEVVKDVFRKIDTILGEPLEEYCFGKNVAKTRNNNMWIQLAITAVNLAYAYLLEDLGLKPVLCLGHSLGEISAVIYTGAISWEDGIRLVRRRGELMNQAATNQPGDMLVLNGLTADEVRNLLTAMLPGSRRSLCLANINTPLQITVSGLIEDLRYLQAYIINNFPQVKTMLLNVGGAWHNPVLSEASDKFKAFLDSLTFNTPMKSFFSVTDRKVLHDPAEIRDSLSRQLTAEVDWVAAIDTVSQLYEAYFLEIGPGKILYGLVTKISRDIACKPVCWIKNPEDMASLLA